MAAFESNMHFPRSSGLGWRSLVAAHGATAEILASQPLDLRHAQFHPAGERRVSEPELIAWRDDLNAWAYDRGFPAPLNEARRSTWDVDLGTRLLEDTRHLPESQHPAVWCWLAIHLLPHFVVYRWDWPAKHEGQVPTGRTPWSRFGNSDKNGLLLARQRIATYGAELATEATEQEFQSIQYRPAFGIDQRVARIILHALIAAFKNDGSNYGKNGGIRSLDADDVCIELRLINSLRPFCFASDEEITAIVDDVTDRLPSIRKATNRKGTAPSDGAT